MQNCGRWKVKTRKISKHRKIVEYFWRFSNFLSGLRVLINFSSIIVGFFNIKKNKSSNTCGFRKSVEFAHIRTCGRTDETHTCKRACCILAQTESDTPLRASKGLWAGTLFFCDTDISSTFRSERMRESRERWERERGRERISLKVAHDVRAKIYSHYSAASCARNTINNCNISP